MAKSIPFFVPLFLFALEYALAAGDFHTPYLGWTSWSLCAIKNHPQYGSDWLTEGNVQTQSDAMKKLLQPYGYNYINIDSFWAADPTKVVDAYGRWTHNTTRFPHGFKAISDYVHNNGQKVGTYLNPGIAVAAVKQNTPIYGTSCHASDIAKKPLQGGNRFYDTYAVNFSHPCAQAYFDSFAQQLADWGVDFLKLDAVSPGSESNDFNNIPDVQAWSAALNKTGRNIWFTISWNIDVSYASTWVKYANAWRVEDDVECYCNTFTAWYSVVRRFNDVIPWLPYVGRGRYSDLDSVDVANGPISGLTDDERRSYFTLWAISASPLYLGNDLTSVDSFGVSLLTNKAVLAINQLGIAAMPTSKTARANFQVWHLAAGTADAKVVVALFNLESGSTSGSFNFADVGLSSTSTYTVRDIWTNQAKGTHSGSYTHDAAIPTHGCVLLSIL